MWRHKLLTVPSRLVPPAYTPYHTAHDACICVVNSHACTWQSALCTIPCFQTHSKPAKITGYLSPPCRSLQPPHTRLSVDCLLNLGVNSYHLVVEIRVVAHENLGVPGRSDKDGVNTTADGRGKYVADL